ncbi:MAG: amidohydrolase family protein, partial [Traorella sp.]
MKTIYYNGQVYTGEDFKEAFIVEKNKFTYVGNSQEALSYANEHDLLIDLENKFVCCGFNDSHMHLLNYGKALRSAKLYEHTTSIQDVIDCMKEFILKNDFKENDWVLGRGFNHDYFVESRMPTRHDLD